MRIQLSSQDLVQPYYDADSLANTWSTGDEKSQDMVELQVGQFYDIQSRLTDEQNIGKVVSKASRKFVIIITLEESLAAIF
jgi:hypothetical protein